VLLVNGVPTDAIPNFSRRQIESVCGGNVTTGVTVTWPDIPVSNGTELTVQVGDRAGNQGEDEVVASVCTPTPTQTNTPTGTFTTTPTPTDTPTSTDTPTPTYTPTATDTDMPVPTDTPTVTETSVPTNTGTPTNTRTPAATDTPTEVPTVNENANLVDGGFPIGTNVINAYDLFLFALNWKKTIESPAPKEGDGAVKIVDVDLLDLAVADKQWALVTPPDPTDTPTVTQTATVTATTTPSPTVTATLTGTPLPTETPTSTGTEAPSATPSPTATETVPAGDINEDTTIDAKDLLLLIQDFGRSY
jgi:hypothetical protein